MILKRLARLALLAACVAVLTLIGLRFKIVGDPLSFFWPGSGFILAVLLARPHGEWAWLVGAAAVGTAAGDFAVSGGISPFLVVPIFEPLFGAILIRRFARDRGPLTLAFWGRAILCGPIASAGIGGALGAAMLVAGLPGLEYLPVMRSWWFADALGQAVVTPAVLALIEGRWLADLRQMLATQRRELLAFLAIFVACTVFLFGSPPDPSGDLDLMHDAVMPILIYAALRFPAGMSFGVLAFYVGFAAWQLSLGNGPFVVADSTPLGRAVVFQLPMLMTAIGVQMVQVLANERRRASRILEKSERRFRDIVETTNEWIWQVDPGGVFLYSSPHVRALLGYEPEELIGVNMVEVIAEQDRSFVERVYRERVVFAHALESVLHRVRRKDGRLVAVETNVVAVLDEHGRFDGCYGAVRDVSARISAEEGAERLREAHAQAEKLVALGTFVSGVAHEINNPNQFITLNVPLVRRAWSDVGPAIESFARGRPNWRIAGLAPEKARIEIAEAIEEVAEGSDRIRGIVSELREYLRGEPGAPAESVALDGVVRSALNLAAGRIRERGQRVETDVAPDLPKVRGHGRRIERVVINLLLNASDALVGRPGVLTVRVSASTDRRFVLLEVSDEGVGISEADQFRVMDPFFTTKRALGGMGLGLAISDRIAREHGGRLELDSLEGRGTTARLVLPSEA